MKIERHATGDMANTKETGSHGDRHYKEKRKCIHVHGYQRIYGNARA
jgi:hypothetical protein